MKIASVWFGIWLVVLMTTCKKEKVAPAAPTSPTTGTRVQFTLDSIFLYAKQIYLWNTVLPTYAEFNPRVKYQNYAAPTDAFTQELFDISQIVINTATGKPYELPVRAGTPKYSYLTTATSTGATASVVDIPLPVLLKDTVITSNMGKVGYIALGSFPELSECQSILDQAFATIGSASPDQMVVDLRSNDGGYVETAEYVADQIAPQSLNGKVMFSEQYNSLLQSGQATILQNQLYLDTNGHTVTYKGRLGTLADVDYTELGNTHFFSKKGNLQSVKNIYFITSRQTASASELLISALKPYFNVKLVGDTTYGKPVGFFPVNIDVYSVYLSGFLIKNSQGWSDYFQGIPADVLVTGGSNPAWGDPSETCFSRVLTLINGTSPTTTSNNVQQKNLSALTKHKTTQSASIPTPLGLIENRLKLKK